MRIREIIREGGWDTKTTQGTVITPSVVKQGLAAMDRFLSGFNDFLKGKSISPVRAGVPTGSSHYHEKDDETAVYGDIDLQIIVPDLPELHNKTQAQIQTFWHNLAGEYVRANPDAAHEEGTPGHPILNIGGDRYVQVDMMIHPEPLAKWGAARTIPERGIKGLLHGNMFSVFGELINLSIQHSGVQYKDRSGVRQPYSTTRKDYELRTISTDPETFVMDVFRHEVQAQGIRRPRIDPLLKQHQGKNLQDVKISNLVNAVKGFARSCELNGMFGRGELKDFVSAGDFLDQFWQRYEGKALKDIAGTKRDKAAGNPAAEARAKADKQKILSGLRMVQGLLA
jgi:hypothetical protein